VGDIAIGVVGIGLMALALTCGDEWVRHHTLRDWFVQSPSLATLGQVWRWCGFALGAVLAVLARRRLAQWLRLRAGRLLASALAAAFALLLCEWVLSRKPVGPPLPEMAMTEPDPELGWRYRKSSSHSIGGIEYLFDDHSERIAASAQPVDPQLPTLVFAGESIAVGFRLPYRDAFPALVSQEMGVQGANLAVQGYSTDQGYGRLLAELPRFRKPIAVVMTFASVQLRRDIDPLRPHVIPSQGGVTHVPAESPWWQRLRLRELWQTAFPFHARDPIPVTRAVLQATASAARVRGAASLFVMIRFRRPGMPETHPEAWIERQLFAEPGLPYVVVELDPALAIPNDGSHPTLAGSRRIASAVTRALAAPAR
jgi:hypothetical protein